MRLFCWVFCINIAIGAKDVCLYTMWLPQGQSKNSRVQGGSSEFVEHVVFVPLSFLNIPISYFSVSELHIEQLPIIEACLRFHSNMVPRSDFSRLDHNNESSISS